MSKPIAPLHYSKIKQRISGLAQGLSLAGLIILSGIQSGSSHGAEVQDQAATAIRSTEEVFRTVQDYRIGNIISQIGFAQARHYRDNQRFVQTLQSLTGDWPVQTEHYQFELVVEEEAVFIIARPLDAALHSFIGMAQVADTQEPRLVETILCRSARAIDQIPPLEMQLLNDDYLELTCPNGFVRFPTHAGSAYIGYLNRAQQAYILENLQFAAQIEDLGFNLSAGTPYHTFKIVLEERTEGLQVVHLALPKYDGIPTYMGITMAIETEEDLWTTTAILCRSMEPMNSGIAIPTRIAVTDPPAECPVQFEQFSW